VEKKSILGLPPIPVIPLSRGLLKGNILSIAGIVPMDETGKVYGTLEEQTHKVLKRIKAIVEDAGGTMDDIVSISVFIKEASMYGPMNDVYQTYFKPPVPARSCLVTGFVDPACLVVMNGMAIIG
jgi:2-iminobutanoate/2-iminopropanoate deaminase